jgi:hypothetical protein
MKNQYQGMPLCARPPTDGDIPGGGIISRISVPKINVASKDVSNLLPQLILPLPSQL